MSYDGGDTWGDHPISGSDDVSKSWTYINFIQNEPCEFTAKCEWYNDGDPQGTDDQEKDDTCTICVDVPYAEYFAVSTSTTLINGSSVGAKGEDEHYFTYWLQGNPYGVGHYGSEIQTTYHRKQYWSSGELVHDTGKYLYEENYESGEPINKIYREGTEFHVIGDTYRGTNVDPAGWLLYKSQTEWGFPITVDYYIYFEPQKIYMDRTGGSQGYLCLEHSPMYWIGYTVSIVGGQPESSDAGNGTVI